MGESSDLQEKEQLVDAVHRDAIRTDPSNPFFAEYRRPEESYVSQHYHQSSDDSNIQKLINIIVIYTLEHGNISYTQGMTDILSPILYVMRNEADAYICFAAMVERIKQHFSQWCTGTLLKLERLRHLCEVLDPKLYACLSANIEEDAFALFFGMVLIECRREFSFEDSFHLLETIWAGMTCSRNTVPSSSRLSNAEWANYMTYHSPEVLQQVFEESGLPYSAIPLPNTMSGSYSFYPYSRNPSLIMSQSPPLASAPAYLRRQSEIEPGTAIPENPDSSTSPIPTPLSANWSNSSVDTQHHRQVVAYADSTEHETSKESQSRARSQSDSNLKGMSVKNHLGSTRSPCHISSTSPRTLRGGVGVITLSHKLGNSSFSHSESELYDSFSNSKVMVQSKLTRHPTEMSDMSSLSSGTTSTNGNLLSSIKSTRNGTPDSATGISRARHRSMNSGSMERGSSISMQRSSSAGMERGGSKVGTSSVGSDTADSDSPSSSKFKDALPYPPSVGVSELPSGILLEPESSSLDGTASPDTVVANDKSPRMTVLDNNSSTPLSSVAGRAVGGRGGDMATRKAYTDPKTGANYVATTCAEVHVDDPRVADPWDEDPMLDISHLQQVIEHNGMITSVGHKSSLVPHRPSGEGTSRSRPQKQSVSDGEVSHRRKQLSSPKWVLRARTPTDCSDTSSPIQDDDEFPSSHRVTPVAFFDAMEKLAESAPTGGAQFPVSFPASLRGDHGDEREPERGGHGRNRVEDGEEEEERDAVYANRRRRANSDAEISMILSQLVSTEEGAPRVSSQDSLAMPFSDCYSLFVCLSILVQNRHEIIRSNADFYQLSMILNAQAAKQDLDKTLRIAHQLHRVYRKYQGMCFGPNGNYENWLDNPEMENS